MEIIQLLLVNNTRVNIERVLSYATKHIEHVPPKSREQIMVSHYQMQ